MSRRITLDEARDLVLEELDRDGGWMTPSDLCDTLGIGHGVNWYRVALTLERLALAGEISIANPGSRGRRRFRIKDAF